MGNSKGNSVTLAVVVPSLVPRGREVGKSDRFGRVAGPPAPARLLLPLQHIALGPAGSVASSRSRHPIAAARPELTRRSNQSDDAAGSRQPAQPGRQSVSFPSSFDKRMKQAGCDTPERGGPGESTGCGFERWEGWGQLRLWKRPTAGHETCCPFVCGGTPNTSFAASKTRRPV